MNIRTLVVGLEENLVPLYTMPNSPGGHDILHVLRMIALGPKIAQATGLQFSMVEFEAAVWLHNIDRGAAVKGAAKIISLEQLVRATLDATAFGVDAKVRIIDVVLRHSKKDDELGDSTLLQAVRIADKLDRLGPLGIISAAAFRGSELPLYDPEHPFGYTSTAEGRMKTVYNDFFRIMEWVGMLPSNQARSLINRQDMIAFVEYVRALGAEIARRHDVKNEVEADIKKALDTHYKEFAF